VARRWILIQTKVWGGELLFALDPLFQLVLGFHHTGYASAR
jgi:hypothetical protein